jgi:hypothetical protein
MKPVDVGTPTPIVAPKSELGDEAKLALEQRLWQLLMALPNLQFEGNPDQVAQVVSSQALDAAMGSSEGHLRARDERDRDVSGALTSAAHLLALTIPQLGLTRYRDESTAAAVQPPVREQTWSMQLGHFDANGGNASVNVAHPLLGDIALDVELSQGAVRVVATVPNDYGARILQEGQAILAERLLRQGVTLEVLDVIVRRKRKDKQSQLPKRRSRKQER